KDEVRPLTVLERRLKQLEARLAVLVERDRLAVDQASRGEVGGGLHQRLELVAPVLAVTGPGGRDAVADGNQQPVTVIFIFVEPLTAGRDIVYQSRQLRRLESGRRLAGLLLGAPALLPAAVRAPHVLARGDLGHCPASGDAGRA